MEKAITYSYKIDGSVLTRPVVVKDVTFDSKLSFVPHIRSMVSTYGFAVRNSKFFVDIDAAPILSRLSFNVKIWATALRNRKIFYAPSVHTNVGLFSPINKLSSAANSVNAEISSDSYTKIRNSLLNTAKYSN
jgi:hypothetical protein